MFPVVCVPALEKKGEEEEDRQGKDWVGLLPQPNSFRTQKGL